MDNQSIILEKGAIERIVEAMNRHSEDGPCTIEGMLRAHQPCFVRFASETANYAAWWWWCSCDIHDYAPGRH